MICLVTQLERGKTEIRNFSPYRSPPPFFFFHFGIDFGIPDLAGSSATSQSALRGPQISWQKLFFILRRTLAPVGAEKARLVTYSPALLKSECGKSTW